MPSKFIKKRRQESFDIFSPKGIPGLVLWLDASDIFSMTFNGNAVSQWNDKSGNNNNVSQGTAANQPIFNATGINNKGILNFDGSSDSMLKNFTGTIVNNTVIIVCRLDTLTPTESGPGLATIETADSSIFDTILYNEYTAKRWGNGSEFWNRTPEIVSPSDETSVGPHIMAITRETNSYILYQNGIMLSSSTSYSPPTINNGNFLIGQRHTGGGNNSHYDGDIAEVIIFNSALSTSNRLAIENYLASKWGINI